MGGCNSAKSYGDQWPRPGGGRRKWLRWGQKFLEGGLAITSTSQCFCCFNEFIGSTLFMTRKHVVIAGPLSIPHQTLSRFWTRLHMASGPVPAVRVSLSGERSGV